ncbi:MAG: glycosyltransferase family 1 protein [Nitrosarchaeum sp.]|nr:MAG: glycosyltransferase family 1 protein [Nitrosarchaeum sp.]
MKTKIKVALIYKNNYPAFQPDFFERSSFDFFIHALKRNSQMEILYFGVDGDYFDTTKLQGTCDVILLANNYTTATPEILDGIHNTGIPVLCRTGDPHSAKKFNQISYHKKWKIDCYFGTIPSSYFYQFYPQDFMYREIIFGLESSLYQNLRPYKERIKDKILNSGNVGKLSVKSRVANSILNPKRNAWYFYKLRTICNKLPYVDHAGMKGSKYVNDDYPSYLSRYRSAIAATTLYPTQKYWEIPAAGCLTFMEITQKNDGYYLGFKDGETAIFINEKNYKDKFEEFLNDPDNTKWEEIANAGREYVMNNLTNDKAVERLVELMKKLL